MDLQRLDLLIDRYMDETAAPEEIAELQNLLMASDDACQRFWESAADHFQFRVAISSLDDPERLPAASTAPTPSSALAPPRRKSIDARVASPDVRAVPLAGDESDQELSAADVRSGLFAPTWHFIKRYPVVSVIAASIAMVLALGTLAVLHVPTDAPAPDVAGSVDHSRPQQFVARLTGTVDATWQGEQPPGDGSIILPGDVLQLTSGLAEITYRSGVRVILTGPAKYEISTAMLGTLDKGSLVARVPRGARGFAIGTPVALVTDLGTEFGVDVDGQGETSAFVTEGEVEVQARQPSDTTGPQRLKAGGGVRVTRDGKVQRLSGNQNELADKIERTSQRVADALGESNFKLISIDWGKQAGSYQGAGPLGDGVWNNPTGTYPAGSVTSPQLVDATGKTTRVTLTVLGNPKSAGDGNLAKLGHPATRSLLQDYRVWVQNSLAYFSGLTPGARYKLAVFGAFQSQTGAIMNIKCRASGVTKSTSASDVSDLATLVEGVSYVQFDNLKADDEGRVAVKFSADCHWFMGAQLASVVETDANGDPE